MESQEVKKKRRGLPVKIIAYSAVFVALSVVTNIFTVHLGVSASNALSFTYTVCFLGGALLGPLPGFIIGACGDVLGYLIMPSGGAFNPFISLVSGGIGLISGLVYLAAKRMGKGDKDILLTVVSFLLILLVCTNLNTVALYFYMFSGKYTFWAYYVIRTPRQILFWALNLVLSLLLIKPLRKLLKM